MLPILQVTQLSGLFLNGFTFNSCCFSFGLCLILKETAGGSGWLRPLLALRPKRWERICFPPCRNHAYCSLESKHFYKLAACPSSRAHETTFRGPVYMVAASATLLDRSASSVCSFLSPWRWEVTYSHQLPHAGGRSEAVGFQSTKCTVRASFPVPQLTTNHCLAFQFCQVLLTGGQVGDCQEGGRSAGTVPSESKSHTRV